MMSASFMIIRSSPSSLISLPDHLPNSTRSPAFVERVQRTGIIARARADGDDLTFRRLFLSRIGDKNATGGFRFRIDTADQDAVLQWTQLHGLVSSDQNFQKFWHYRNASASAYSSHGVDADEIPLNYPAHFIGSTG